MKRLLLLSYYFPPSGGPGVQRPLKLAKYLPHFGWQPTVLTVRPGQAAFPDRDETLLRDVPAATRVERTAAWDPYALYARLKGKEKSEAVSVGFIDETPPDWRERLARWLRANVFLPDARVGWVPFAVRRGHALLRAGAADAILTTGPPHSTHLAGLLLSRWTGVPWVADFRDPWTDISYYEQLPVTAPARWLDRQAERAVLSQAHCVTAVNPHLARLLRGKTTGARAAPVHVIRNGFDPDDFSAPHAEGEPHAESASRANSDSHAAGGSEGSKQREFVLAHVGSLTASQIPHALWKALQRLRERGAAPPLRIQMVGNLDQAVRRSMRAHGLEDALEPVPYVPHAEAIRYMQGASLLLLCINQTEGAESITPGKTYEYVASGRPVLGVGPPEGDAAAVVRASEAGRTFAHGDVDGIARFLADHFQAWKRGTPERGASPAAAEPFSRRGQAGALAERLGELAGPRAAAP